MPVWGRFFIPNAVQMPCACSANAMNLNWRRSIRQQFQLHDPRILCDCYHCLHTFTWYAGHQAEEKILTSRVVYLCRILIRNPSTSHDYLGDSCNCMSKDLVRWAPGRRKNIPASKVVQLLQGLKIYPSIYHDYSQAWVTKHSDTAHFPNLPANSLLNSHKSLRTPHFKHYFRQIQRCANTKISSDV